MFGRQRLLEKWARQQIVGATPNYDLANERNAPMGCHAFAAIGPLVL